MNRISLRSFLITLLVILVIMTLILLYLYYLISKPFGGEVYSTKNMRHILSIYGYGTKEEQMLYKPSDVAFDSDGNVYITDTGHSRVLVFDYKGRYLRRIGKRGTGNGELIEPVGISVSEDGRTYVADKALSKVVIYGPTGRTQNEIKIMVPFKPFVANNKLYVTTYGHIMVYDLRGKQLSQWSQKGRRPGFVDSPLGLTVAKNGSVYVADTLNLRLQSYSRTGKLLWIVGQPASNIQASDRKFGLPCGIAIDSNNLLYLADAFHSNVKVLNTKGKQIVALGKAGDKDGELNMPSGIAYYQGNVFAIADKFNNRVQLMEIIVQ